MNQRAVTRAETEVFRIIRQEQAEGRAVKRGPTRDEIRVIARGRGIEIVEPLANLQAMGLIELVERRPGFLRRLFGARRISFFQPTEAGRAFDLEAAEATARMPGVTAASADGQPAAWFTPGPAVATYLHAAPETAPEVEAPSGTPPETAPDMAAGAVAPAAPTPADRPASPGAGRFGAIFELAHDAVDEAELMPQQPLTEFPDEEALQPVAAAGRAPGEIDPEEIEGIHQVIYGLGMEPTEATEPYIFARISEGLSTGEVVSRMVLAAFAHELARRGAGIEPGAAEALQSYAVEVMQEVEKLRDAGQIREALFEADMRALWEMVTPGPAQLTAALNLLAEGQDAGETPARLPEELLSAEG